MRMISNWLKLSKRANLYKTVFNTPEGQFVLADLKKFCRLELSTLTRNPITGSVDQVATNHAEGRREVMLRIMALTNLSYEDILRLKANEELDTDV
jgi:hypothetical protein